MRVCVVVSRIAMALGALAIVLRAGASPQDVDVQARVEVLRAGSQKAAAHGSGNVVVWLTPAPGVTTAPIESDAAPGRFRMEQKNKGFTPHLLVVPLGSTVEFPNLDPFFHNVFSQFNGKRFDLGLYEAGTTKSVRFDHEGISYLFCNIHSQMAAVIVTLRTPHFAVAAKSSVIELHNVPAGDYEMHVWAEGADLKQLDALTRRVHIAASQRNLGEIRIDATGAVTAHKNKFGEDYRPDPVQSY
jgi:plastocyanin